VTFANADRAVRRPIAIVVVAIFASACALGRSAPAAVQPTLDALTALGLHCGDGIPDNVPSGLSQWHCRAKADGDHGDDVLVNGNNAGIAELDVVTVSDDPAPSRTLLIRVVATTPPLAALDGLAADLNDALIDWAGEQRTVNVRGLTLRAECLAPNQFGPGQCLITITGPNPIKPMLGMLAEPDGGWGHRVTFTNAD
jgi:hypothetical protein